ARGPGARGRPEVRRGYQRAAAEAIDFFSAWLGPYAYGTRFALVEVGGSLGCMENAGAAAMMIGAIQGRDEAREMAVHEVAHHWFGDNLRIRNSGEFWMGEGFTNYLTYRFFGRRDGRHGPTGASGSSRPPSDTASTCSRARATRTSARSSRTSRTSSGRGSCA